LLVDLDEHGDSEDNSDDYTGGEGDVCALFD
jgi:hypothetical protein